MDYAITNEEFQRFSALVYQQSGTALSASKKALVVSRLSKRLRALGLDTFSPMMRRWSGWRWGPRSRRQW